MSEGKRDCNEQGSQAAPVAEAGPPPGHWQRRFMADDLMSFHYLPAEEVFTTEFTVQPALEFTKRIFQLCAKHKAPGVVSRAMDVGCGVGGVTFQLAREFEEVIGLDISKECIAKCQELKASGQAEYTMMIEGKLREKKVAVIDPEIDRERVTFLVADACNLDPNLRNFGFIVTTNTVAHLPDARAFLASATNSIVPGGILIISDHYSSSPEELSMGGYVTEEGKELRGFDVLQQCLSAHFDLVDKFHLPWVRRKTATLYLMCVAHTTVWKKKL